MRPDARELSVESYIDSIDVGALSPRQRARFEIEVDRQQRFTDEARDDLASSAAGPAVRRDESLAPHTTLGVGGAADAFIETTSIDMLKDVIAFARERDIPVTVIGRGSSLVVRDGGVRGIVVKLGSCCSFIAEEFRDESGARLRVGGATHVADLYAFARAQVLECQSAWGSGAGTAAGRVMTDPSGLRDAVEEVTVVDRQGRETTLTRKALRAGNALRIGRNSVIISMLIAVPHMTKREETAEPTAVTGGAGRIDGVFRDVGSQPAASVIADAGLAGVRVGGMRIDEDNANRMVHEREGRARDAVVLIGLVRDRVKQAAGIALEVRARIIGED